jgi:gamma-glutamyltranspeptidase/glutathione hydrolase
MKLAFADVYRYVAEPRSMRLTPAQMLDDSYLASRARLIDPGRAQDFGPGHPPQGGTIYLTAADARHDGQLHPEQLHGFRLGRGGAGLRAEPAEPRPRLHLDPASDNCVAPGKRPFHTIIPAFLTKDGEPSHEFRRDGRRHAAAGPPADPGAHAGLPARTRRPPATRHAGATLAAR